MNLATAVFAREWSVEVGAAAGFAGEGHVIAFWCRPATTVVQIVAVLTTRRA